jgi:Uma2 family endonuclease
MAQATHSTAAELPRLETGMHMTVDEFHRAYEQRPDVKHAELVDGVVYVSSPLNARDHGTPHGTMMAWVVNYTVTRPTLDYADNATLFVPGSESEVQPDVMLWDTQGGRCRDRGDGYIDGSPELVIEVAASSAFLDAGAKLRVYQRAGVQEYVIWFTEQRRFTWYAHDGAEFVALEPDTEGWIESRAFRGLRMHPEGLIAGDRTVILET